MHNNISNIKISGYYTGRSTHRHY